MMSSSNLPVILLSAGDNAAATKIISELIENEVEDNKYKEAGWRVWKFINKYYTALVHVQPLTDGEELLDIQAEAHVIYLTENEGVEEAEARRVRAASAVCRGAVRLALVEAAEITEGVAAWGLRARFEAVALRGEGGEGAEAADEGAGRARAALHAHVWPSLRRRGPAPLASLAHGLEGLEELEGLGGLEEAYSSSDGEGAEGSEGSGGEEGAVERAEAFAEALGGLGALRAAPDADEHRGLRLARAEQLVAAFARALGHRLDA